MPILSALLALQAASHAAAAAEVQPYQDPNVAAVMAPVHSLIAAFDRGDAAAVAALVYPEGRITATGTRGLSGSGLRQQSWTQFVSRISPEANFQETLGQPAVEVDGDVALVWVPYVVRVKGKVANCGFDHFDLVRENGGWKIMNLTYSARVTECSQD